MGLISGLARCLVKLVDDTVRFVDALGYRWTELWGDHFHFRSGAK